MTINLDKTESIAVIIPTINRPGETKRAVESVLNQSYPIKEIVVVDDGSTPNNLEALKKELLGAPVTLLHSGITRHPGRARNVGIESISSEWVAFLDSDDIWERSKVEKQLELARQTGSEAICTNAFALSSTSSDRTRITDLPKAISLRALLQKNSIINSSVLIRTELLKKVGGVASSYSVRGVEDYATWLRVASLTQWGIVDLPLVGYTMESMDTVRRDEEFLTVHNSYFAVLDFVAWKKPSKIASKLLGAIIKFSRWIVGCMR